MNNWGRFIGNPNRKEVASMWSASPGFIPTQGCTSWLLWYLRFILLKRINRREWSGCECLYKWAKRHWHRKIKDPIRRQWSDPFHQRWDSARWFERGSRGSERERCSGCRSLSFPDFTSIPHMEPLWLPPFSLCPLLSVLSDSELEAVLSFLSSWRVTSVHLWDEKMTISLPVFHLTRFFFFFQVRGSREEGNYYMRGERGPGDAALPGLSGEEEDRDAKLDGGETRDLWKWLGMTQEKLPPSSSRPVLSESVSHNGLSLQ